MLNLRRDLTTYGVAYEVRSPETGFIVRRLTLMHDNLPEDQEMTENNSDFEVMGRDDILNADDLRYELVDVPEWGKGKKVRVRSLPGEERDAFESSLLVGSGKTQRIMTLNIRAKLCALSIVDAHGVPLFTLADIDKLGRKSAAALDRIFEVAQRLSRVSDKDVEEMVGNSETALSDDS